MSAQETFVEPLGECPVCHKNLNDHGVCDACGTTVYDFCGEHVRNHNGKTYIRFIQKGWVVMCQVSSHKISLVKNGVLLEAVDPSISLDEIGDC